MKFWHIKWENIFGITMAAILIGMTIKYIILNGFDSFSFMFDILYVSLSTFVVMVCVKKTREFYLDK